MKKVILLLVFLGASEVFAAESIDAITWHGVQIYDVASLKKVEELQIGKIVGIRCQFRSKRVRHLKPSWWEASLWQQNPQDKRNPFTYIRVLVSRNDLPAFEALPNDLGSGKPMTLYGQVQKDADAGYVFVRLIGTKVKTNPDRSAIVSW